MSRSNASDAKPASRLGTILRESRRQHGLTGSELAGRIGISQGTLSKLEGAKLVPSIDLLCRLAMELEVPTDELEGWLAEAQLLPAIRPLPLDFLRAGDIERSQRALEGIERRASTLRVFQPQVVPGHLQTEAYAAGIMRLMRVMLPETERLSVRARMKRKGTIAAGKQFTFVLTEDALRARVCSSKEMARQIDHIIESSHLPNLWIGVIPWSTRLTAGRPMRFYIYDSNLVHVELPHGYVPLTRKQDIVFYEHLFAAQLRMAVAGEEMVSVLDRIKRDHLRLAELEREMAPAV
jgi:transcriptional regulator with XRE-family HTH domain